MTKSDQIRTHFLYHPNAKVLEVVEKFKASKPMVYKLHKEARARLELMKNAELPDTVPMPTAEHEAASRAASLISRSKLTDKQRKERAAKYFPDAAKVSVGKVLEARGQDYGKFRDSAGLMQGIKRLLADHAIRHNKVFADDQWEALEMIVHKISRIVNGNPDKVDHWVDIAGYATLVADRLEGIDR
jgi:hypothetical protein